MDDQEAKLEAERQAQEAMRLLADRTEPAFDPKGPPEARIDLLQQELRQERAYIFYLEDLLREAGVEPNFNALESVKRQDYFHRADDNRA